MFIHLTSSQFLRSCSLGFSSCTKFKHGQCKISHVTFFYEKKQEITPYNYTWSPLFYCVWSHRSLYFGSVWSHLFALPLSWSLCNASLSSLLCSLTSSKDYPHYSDYREQFFSRTFPRRFTQIKAIAITAITASNFFRLFSGKFIQIKAIAITGSISSSTFLGKLTQTKKRWRVWMCSKKPDRKQAIAQGQKVEKNASTGDWSSGFL